MYVKKSLYYFYYIYIFPLNVFTTAGTPVKLKQYLIDVGKNLTLPCPVLKSRDVMWIRDGRSEDEQAPRLSIQEDGSLFLQEVDKNDSGIYTCTPSNSLNEEQSSKMKVIVRTPPPPLIDVQVHQSTILAVILWGVSGTGGYPIIYFTAQFRLADSDSEWLDITPIHIPPNARQIDVYKLEANTTYAFRVWATNHLGNSEITVVYSTTKVSNETAELERHFLQGVKNFDTRIWVVAVGVVMGTLVVLGFGTCFLLYQECRAPSDCFKLGLCVQESDDQEVIELVPNIILNPGFDGDHTERFPSDENSNNERTTRLNNNTVVHPPPSMNL
ncbi:PREDICTED: protein sax-3-like isoform X2 [Nicrophorus vespilloides]|uniref:Protein sax-3-like isoform X2 n=1 Tax=Nicrophorus vespilloides TaxID=110193 RepID=A0ABM1NDH1_NICVS|nr:PREDICTED: protein sax-3-like isoform X2 [Nicrophorus vespilloides]